MQAPNCYTCKYRKDVGPGEVHSRCIHPTTEVSKDDDIDTLIGMLGGRMPTRTATNEIGVTGSQHGINRGWFMWPFNFDPVWLLTCNGHTEKEEVSNEHSKN